MLINGAVVLGVLHGSVGWARFLAWVGVLWAAVAVRFGTWILWRREPADARPRRWDRAFMLGAGLNGLAWGALAALFFPSMGVPERLFVTTVVAGMVAGSASSTSGHPAAFLAFAVPALSPALLRLLWAGSPLEVATGAMGCLFGGSMWLLARNTARTLTDALELRFHNEALVVQLSAARERLTAVNAGLEERIRVRTAELVDLERQLSHSALLATVGSLAASVAHDINSPLAGLISNVGVIERELAGDAAPGAAPSVSQEALADVRACADRVRAIVRSLGDVARREGPPHWLDLREVLESCLAVAMPELRTRARVVRDHAVPARVHADRADLSQVFLALLLHVSGATTEKSAPLQELLVATRRGAGQRSVEVEISREAAVGPDGRPALRLEPGPSPPHLPLTFSHVTIARLGGRIAPARGAGRVGFTVTLPTEDLVEPP